MPKDIVIARVISLLLRPRVAFWLFLALLLSLATLIQLSHTMTTSAIGSDVGYTLVSADDQTDSDCTSHGGAIAGSHCCSMSSCATAALAIAPAAVAPVDVEATQATVNDTDAPHRAPSPFFHPPKLIVQA